MPVFKAQASLSPLSLSPWHLGTASPPAENLRSPLHPKPTIFPPISLAEPLLSPRCKGTAGQPKGRAIHLRDEALAPSWGGIANSPVVGCVPTGNRRLEVMRMTPSRGGEPPGSAPKRAWEAQRGWRHGRGVARGEPRLGGRGAFNEIITFQQFSIKSC